MDFSKIDDENISYFRSGDNIEKIIGICRLFNDYDIPCEIIVYDEKNRKCIWLFT